MCATRSSSKDALARVALMNGNIKNTTAVTAEAMPLMCKCVAINQHSRNTHGPMTTDKLVRKLLEDVAAAVKDKTTWQGGHMALVLSKHGCRNLKVGQPAGSGPLPPSRGIQCRRPHQRRRIIPRDLVAP
jgi:hypothetical protein